MSRTYRLAPSASRDINAIFDYLLSTDGIDAAMHIYSGLERAFEKLGRMPGIGHRREQFTSSNLLFFNVWSYYVVYKPDSSPLEIVRIIHSARDIPTAMDEIT